jgi:predicted nucleic acid-binding Zn ribbon protein
MAEQAQAFTEDSFGKCPECGAAMQVEGRMR